MDSLPDNEIESIWGRVKKYINPRNITSTDISDIAKEIEREMRQASEATGKSGSIETLLKKGFAKRAVEVSEIRKELPTEAKKPPISKIAIKKRLKLPPKVKRRKGNKLAIKVGKKTRILSAKTTKITRGKWKGRNAYWIYNLRKKRIITWGLE